MLTMYSKLFTAGLNPYPESTTIPTSPHSAEPTRSSWPTDTSSSQRRASSSVSFLFSPTSLENATPSMLFPRRAKNDGELFFTLRPKPVPTARHGKAPKRLPPTPPRVNENDLRSFLSLDLAESTKSIRSRRTKASRTSLSEAEVKSFFVNSMSSSSTSAIKPVRRPSVPRRKPVPKQISVLPLPPRHLDGQGPSSAPPFQTVSDNTTTAHGVYRRPSAMSALTARPSVKRANRFDALAALEGRHKRSFWDEEDELSQSPPLNTALSAFTDDSSPDDDLFTPPPPSVLPLQDMSMNIDLPLPSMPVIGASSHAKRRKRASTIESWLVPSSYLDELNYSVKNDDIELEDDREARWTRLVGVNLALVS